MAARKMNVALIGYSFMGKAHSNAWRQVSRFFDTPIDPVMKVICGRTESKVTAMAEKYGWEEAATDFREVVTRPDIDIVDVTTANNAHAEVALAAAEAGKIVLCEKPLAMSVAQARQMLGVANAKGITHAICHNYRYAPAVSLAKKIIEEGRLGKIYHFRGVYLQDWILDPEFPIVWRLDKSVAGSGSHGDLAAHLIDTARWLVGEIDEVTGMMDTFIKERPMLAEIDDRLGGTASSEKGQVTVDDSSIFMARFANGAVGTFEASRFCAGRKNFQRWEINGSKGSLAFNLENMNELEVYFTDDEEDVRGFRTITVTDGCHPYTGNYWPAAHIIGYEHTFTNLVKELLDSVAEGRAASPNWEDGLRNQQVLEAVELSSGSRSWVRPDSL